MRRLRHFALALVIVCCGAFGLLRLPAKAADCPGLLMLEPIEGQDYLAVFSARFPIRASFRVEAYTRRAAYVFALHDLAIDRAASLEAIAYRSLPVRISVPGSEPLLRALITAADLSAGGCSAFPFHVPSESNNTSPATRLEVARELASVRAGIVPDPLASPQAGCSAPFVEAKAVRIAAPTYPRSARDAGITGTALIKVSLDATGAVTDTSIYASSRNADLDTAALDAARKTVFSPEVRACVPQGGSYLFTAKFQPRPS